MYFPNVIETTGRGSKAWDLPTKLLNDRIIYFGSDVNPDTANYTIMQLLWLNADNPEEPIDMYINSPGGSVYDGLAIKDVIDKLDCKVNTVGVGICMSMGAYLLAAGTGTRKAMKNCRIMVHSVSSGTGYSTVHDQRIDFKETQFLQDVLINDIANFTKGKLPIKELEKRSERDWYMSAEEAIEIGLIDSIV